MVFNKKGIDIGYKEIFGIIFILIFAVLWFKFQNEKFKPAQEEFFDLEACRISVLKASFPTQGVLSLSDLNGCKTQEIKTAEIDPDLIHENLAANINNCWYMFGNGKVDFLKNIC